MAAELACSGERKIQIYLSNTNYWDWQEKKSWGMREGRKHGIPFIHEEGDSE